MRLAVYLLTLLLTALLQTCVDPVVPEYDYRTGFYIIEGRILDQPGYSSVRVSRSEISFGNYRLTPINGATVSSTDERGNQVAWSEVEGKDGSYQPDSSFAGQAGSSYQLVVLTPTGETIESTAEMMPGPVPIKDLRMVFLPEAYFSADRERFVPAFQLLVDLQDPPGEDNFYQFYHRTWSRTAVCETCYGGVYRDGRCVNQSRVDYYDYLCDRTCWSIQSIPTFFLLSDELNPGANFTSVPAGRIDYVNSGGLLAEVEQYAIGRRAYLYYTELRNLTEGSAGLNAPLPAALYGNLSERDDQNAVVLGYVAAASLSTRRLYWNRDTIPGEPFFRRPPTRLEPITPSPPTAPCEGENYTPTQPEGWPD